MRAYLVLISLVAVACAEKPASEGGDLDLAVVKSPEVWIEAGQGLPADESSVNSLEVTVSGNETAKEYQYALFSDASVTCAAAPYGEFKSISTKITEIDLGNNGQKIICLRGKDEAGNVQANPKRYSWTKVDGVALAEQMPEVKLEKLLTDSDKKINSKVIGNDITTSYQYVLVNAERYDCGDIKDDLAVGYSASHQIGKILALDIGADGSKTLCLRGLDQDDRLQNEATRYTWVKKTPPEPNPDNEKSAVGAPGIDLSNDSITFLSGSGNAVAVTVQNFGAGTLQWSANTASAASWLQVKKSDGNYVALASGELARGALASNESALVVFKLAQDRGTDYGKPYQREHEIVFVNEDSGFEMTAKIALEIPRLDNKTVHVALTRNSAPVKVYAKNLNKDLGMQPMEIEVVPAFPITIPRDEKVERDKKFKTMVTVETGLASTGTNAGEQYVEFMVNTAGVKGCESYSQTILVYSNGDSKGASDCSIEAWTQYIGRSTGASWTTRRCKRIVVTFNTWKHLDPNDDGKINIFDIVEAAANFGDPPDPMTDAYRLADVDGNGKVDQADLDAISACFGHES